METFTTVYQYTEPQLEAAVKEAARLGRHVAVHATGEPGTLFAAQAGVVLDRSCQPTER